MKRCFTFMLTFTLLGLSSCGNDDLPEYFLLDRLRVLAAHTTGAAAEFSAGDAGVDVTFHVSDPTGAGRSLSYEIVECVDPGVSIGVTPSCDGNPTATTAVTGTFTPGSAATNYYGTLTTPTFTIPAAGVIFLDPRTGAPRSAVDQYNGVGYLVILKITASATEQVTAFKRIVVSTKSTKNQNPSTPSLLFGGVAPGSYTLTQDRFAVVDTGSAASAESYTIARADGSFSAATETLSITWLVNAGEMRFSRTDPGVENRYTPASSRPALTSFIAVLRDDRGGMSVVAFHKP